MDVLTKEQRRKAMKGNKSKDTKIEIRLRKALWSKGVRYRKNYPKLPGKPDIALTQYKIAIFCDSEFWHGRDWEIKKKKLDTNRDFWVNKIERNIERDKEVNRSLKNLGWTVIRIWGDDINNDLNSCILKIEKLIASVKLPYN